MTLENKNSCRESLAKARISKILALVMAAGLAIFALSGCTSQPEDSAEEAIRVFGIESEAALSMNFVNETGQEITGIALKAVGVPNATFGDNLIGEDTPWATEETVTVFVDSYDVITEEATSETASAIDVELLPTYDIQFTFGDGTAKVLHAVTFSEAEEVAVRLDEETKLCYLTYELDGAEASSLESEIAVQKAEEQAKAAAEAAQAAAEEAEQNVVEEYWDNGYAYDYGYADTSGSEPAAAAGGSVDQTQDSCINPDDLILNE